MDKVEKGKKQSLKHELCLCKNCVFNFCALNETSNQTIATQFSKNKKTVYQVYPIEQGLCQQDFSNDYLSLELWLPRAL